MMKITSILLDLDDTLVVEEASAYESFLAAADHLNKFHNINRENFISKIRKEARELWYSLATIDYASKIGISSWEALWADFSEINEDQKALMQIRDYYQQNSWYNALKKFRIDDKSLAEALSLIYREDRRERHILFDDTKPFLEELSKLNLKTALITNGIPDLQWQKINKSGIKNYFSAITISGEFGSKKPDKEIFTHTLDKLKVRAEDAVMIGNSLESDIKGANDSGIRSIWLNRNKEENKTDIIPDYEIDCLDFNIVKSFL